MTKIEEYIKRNFNGREGIPNLRVYNPYTGMRYYDWNKDWRVFDFDNESFIMMGTGVPDVKGQEIYPGDVLKIMLTTDLGKIVKYGVVRGTGVKLGVDIIQNADITDFGCFVDDILVDSREIIGNIFENKDLIAKLG